MAGMIYLHSFFFMKKQNSFGLKDFQLFVIKSKYKSYIKV